MTTFMNDSWSRTGDALGDFAKIAQKDERWTERHTYFRQSNHTQGAEWLLVIERVFAEPIPVPSALGEADTQLTTLVLGSIPASFDYVTFGHAVGETTYETDEPFPDEMSQIDAVVAIEGLVRELGLTQRDVLHAANISRSTYHSWKKTGKSRRPRVASEGKLWAVIETVNDLKEIVGPELKTWLLANPKRLRAFTSSRMDLLLNDAGSSTRMAEPSPRIFPSANAVGADGLYLDEVIRSPVRARSIEAAPVPKRRGKVDPA